MGTKRESVEGRITTYFQTADVLEAVLMFKVIKSILLSRGFELDGRKTAQKKSKAAGKKATAQTLTAADNSQGWTIGERENSQAANSALTRPPVDSKTA